MTKNARRFIFIATATMVVAAVVSIVEAVSPEMVPDAFFIIIGGVLAAANLLYKMYEETTTANRHRQATIKLSTALVACIVTALLLFLAFGATASVPLFAISAFIVGALISHLRPQYG